MTRKLASIRKIKEILPIPNVDAIELAVVDGWRVVIAKKDGFTVGNLVIYCEIDSWIPEEVAPFLSKGQKPRVFNEIKGERLRTVKLRGQISQGLILPLALLGETVSVKEGDDVSDILGIVKWEPPVSVQVAGYVRGPVPWYIPETNQDRVQNIPDAITVGNLRKLRYEVTEKLDGMSMTVYVNKDEDDLGACSHHCNLKQSDVNIFWIVEAKQDLINKIKQSGLDLALQGELIGEGIQKNRYGIKGHRFMLFDIYDIRSGKYWRPEKRVQFARVYDIPHVPVIDHDYVNTLNIEGLLDLADGMSVLTNTPREGLVFKNIEDTDFHFKVISNKFLLKS